MAGRRWQRSRPDGGWAVLALIIVVVIIMVMMFWGGPLTQDPVTHVTQAQNDIDRARTAACAVNRQAVAANLLQWMALNPGERPTVQQLSDMVHGRTCPSGGVFLMGKDGTIYCTLHQPPPPALLHEMIELYRPTPTPTPISSDTLPPDFDPAAGTAR